MKTWIVSAAWLSVTNTGYVINNICIPVEADSRPDAEQNVFQSIVKSYPAPGNVFHSVNAYDLDIIQFGTGND